MSASRATKGASGVSRRVRATTEVVGPLPCSARSFAAAAPSEPSSKAVPPPVAAASESSVAGAFGSGWYEVSGRPVGP
jgi:hypothetical protein